MQENTMGCGFGNRLLLRKLLQGLYLSQILYIDNILYIGRV